MNGIKILMLTILIIIPTLSISAAEIKEIRYYSDTDKTRITVELNDDVQYQTQFNSEKSIIIYLLNTRAGSANRLTRINDKLVKNVTLIENEDNTYIKTTLTKPATFIVFSLNSPFRVVIDVIPTEKFNISGPINPESVNDKTFNQSKELHSPKGNNSINEQKVQSIKKENTIEQENKINESNTGTLLQVNSKFDFLYSMLKNENVMLVQFALDFVFIIVISVIGVNFIQFSRIYKEKKTEKSVKKKPVFTDIINEVENDQISKIDKDSEPEHHAKKANNEEKKDNKGNITIPKEYEKVYELFQRGMDRISISQKSNIPIGEVNLILDLMKSRKESNAV